VELVALFKGLAHAPAEAIIIRPRQDSIGRQALRRWGRHRGMISRASTANFRNRRASLPGLRCLAPHAGPVVSVSDPKVDCDETGGTSFRAVRLPLVEFAAGFGRKRLSRSRHRTSSRMLVMRGSGSPRASAA
jgi:hypothetical protein